FSRRAIHSCWRRALTARRSRPNDPNRPKLILGRTISKLSPPIGAPAPRFATRCQPATSPRSGIDAGEYVVSRHANRIVALSRRAVTEGSAVAPAPCLAGRLAGAGVVMPRGDLGEDMSSGDAHWRDAVRCVAIAQFAGVTAAPA